MAINRNTRKETLIYLLETFAVLGALAGAGLGIYQMLGKPLPTMLVSAFQLGFLGFIIGSAIGLILGVIAAIIKTISP
jgi:hypothetical protein